MCVCSQCASQLLQASVKSTYVRSMALLQQWFCNVLVIIRTLSIEMEDSNVTKIFRSGENVYPMERLCSDGGPTLVRESGMEESKHARDREELARFGKRQQLRVSHIHRCMIFSHSCCWPDVQRNFGLFSIVGLTCTLMITWEGFTTWASLAKEIPSYID